MNEIWSKYVQGTNTLYCSRKLRFDDMFREQYKELFSLPSEAPLNILEIGCGPGALAGALLRWYPNAKITAIDRDHEFIRFAKENEHGIEFSEGDATALPFKDNTFDVTISNTVAEHIEPEKFYTEQLRVLKPHGICLVLSARRGITVKPQCTAADDFEKAFWEKAAKYDRRMEQYGVCRYPMSEAEIPKAMENYGFRGVSTGYLAINLTPDHPSISKESAYQMINSSRSTALDAIQNAVNALPEHFTDEEISEMQMRTNQKYDLRLEQYESGEKQWDVNVSLTMIIRGEKQP